MNKNLLTIGLFILLPFFLTAQDFQDALRYSSSRIEGTARSGGMGNAFGALGNDFTAVGINPAGLGIYRTSEFVITPNFSSTSAQSLYLNNSNPENDFRMGLSNASYIGTIKSKKSSASGLVSVNFGIGYNKLRDFNSFSVIEGNNAQASFLDYIAENANASDWSDFYEELAWQTDVLLYDTIQRVYWHDAQDAGYGQNQRKSITRKGSTGEYILGLGFNFNHRFYLGASLGFNDLYYEEATALREKDDNNKIPYLNEFTFASDLRTYASGFNFKIGAIFKPISELRLGLALATPTFYSLNDKFETYMESSITYADNSTERYDADSPLMEYDYELVTPLKATLSGAFVIGKKGLISADYEYMDYSLAKLRNGGDGYDFIDQNNDIKEIFKPASNLRLGGEFRFTDAFAIRAGYEFHQSAFNQSAFGVDQPNADMNYQVYSAGFGYSSGSFFVDVAYRHSAFGEYATLYPVPKSDYYPVPELAKTDFSTDKLIFTLGFRF